MRPVIYTTDEIMEFHQLRENTNVVAQELEDAFLKMAKRYELSNKEVLYTLARVADSFVRMNEDYNFDPKNSLDAEAAFTDYFTSCRDIPEDGEANIVIATNQKGS